MRVLVTGGCGFIGANFIAASMRRYPHWELLNIDALTYAAAPLDARSLESSERYRFEQVDVRDAALVASVVGELQPQLIVHFAAETHVDRSIHEPRHSLSSNVEGTVNLLEAARALARPAVVHVVSTDEVYGASHGAPFDERAACRPSSPYAASKASANHWSYAYHRTYGLDVRITNGSNTYGPRQFPEKLVPLMILRLLKDEPLPIYGSGLQVRDWLYVDDHCAAIWAVLERGRAGESYNVASGVRVTNLELVQQLCSLVAEAQGVEVRRKLSLIHHVADRPGHDLAYHVATKRIETECGWRARVDLREGLRRTVDWYLSQPAWLARATGQTYDEWLRINYGERGAYRCE